jgi:hypothetical protein
MLDTSTKNSPIPAFLRIVTIVECVVVAAAAFVLFFSPPLAKIAWVWDIPPYNSRYTGAIYFAALLPLVVFAITARWSPGRVVLWMILTFTTSIFAVMLLYIPSFLWDRLGTPIYWLFYVFLPFNSVFFLYYLRKLTVAGAEKNSSAVRTMLLAMAGISALYGIGLLVAPSTVTSFWPWAIDDFHARIYAATYLTPAVGAWIIRSYSSYPERLVLGLTLATLGILSIVGTAWTSTQVPLERQVDYASLGTSGFIAMNLVWAGLGLQLIRSGKKK